MGQVMASQILLQATVTGLPIKLDCISLLPVIYVSLSKVTFKNLWHGHNVTIQFLKLFVVLYDKIVLLYIEFLKLFVVLYDKIVLLYVEFLKLFVVFYDKIVLLYVDILDRFNAKYDTNSENQMAKLIMWMKLILYGNFWHFNITQ